MATKMEGPTAPTAEDEAYAHARQRAEMIQGLYIHILIYALVNAGLFLLNWLITGGDGPWWAIWPLVGWGIGLLIHVLATAAPVFSPQWVDRRAERIVRRGR